MLPFLEYRTQRYSTLLVDIDPGAEFRRVVDDFGTLRFPPIGINGDLVGFALLELVSNSIRAHRERSILDPVRVSFTATPTEFSVAVVDSGRGFNPGLLPYDIYAPVQAIDLMGDPFIEYRERNNGSRFGMGIYSVKKIFPRFSLAFIDRDGRTCPWFSGSVRGTRIDLGIPCLSNRMIVQAPEPVEIEEL